MLNNLTTWDWIQVFLGLMFVRTITCDCLFPSNDFPHGKIEYQSPEDVNETIAEENYILRFICDVGYTIVGPKYIQCIDNEWTAQLPICATLECENPPDIENAEYVNNTGFNDAPTLGSSANYSCKFGYELNDTDASVIICVWDRQDKRAVWKGKLPVCKEKISCSDPGVSNNGFRYGNCCYTESVLYFQCDYNFELVGKQEIRCLPAGIWSSGRPLCRPLEEDHCELPPSIPHGMVEGGKEGDYFLLYEEAHVLCEPGYKATNEFIACEEPGIWEEEIWECTEIFCKRPSALENGTILELENTNFTTFPYEFEITYICNEGYRLLGGDSWRICDKRGWSGRQPYCEAIKCPNPGLPEGGSRSGNNFEVGCKVQFTCYPGYHLLGSFERYCMPNGQWSGTLARCDLLSKYCPDPGIPIKGFKNSTSYELGDTVSFHCQFGYFQIGSEVRECLPDGIWSGTETKCFGPYDFDNRAQIRDFLNAKVAEIADEQKQELKKFNEALRSWHENWWDLEPILPFRIILYFAFDVSGSVGSHNIDKSIEFAKAIVKRVGISEDGARAGALTFSYGAQVMFSPFHYNSTQEVLNALDNILFISGGITSSAFTLIRYEFIPQVNEHFGKKNVKSILFLLTDGKANMGGDPQYEADILKRAGVQIYCIGITGSIANNYLNNIASTSKKSLGEEIPNVFILQNYVTMSWLVQEITNGTIDYSQCGLRLENGRKADIRGRIAGRELIREPWPWMAALYTTIENKNPPQIKLQCGGSIIHPNFILTAAHCMYNKKFETRDKKEIIVKLGLTDEAYVQEYEVINIHIHEEYRPGPLFDYDIALLQLDRPADFNAFVRPVCLPPKELPHGSRFYSPRESAWAAGWGHDGMVSPQSNKTLKTTHILKEVHLSIESQESCNRSLFYSEFNASYFTERMFCAGDGKRGCYTRKGISGGPLIQSEMNSEGYVYWTQVGLTSWSIGYRHANTYAYYSHVQILRPWIDDIIKDALKDID